MSWGIVAGAAVGLVGSAMSADAAGDAADAQVGASNSATALEREMFEKQVELQRPWREAGGAGLNRLAFLMGLSPTGFGGASPLETEDAIRARLKPRFMTEQPAAPFTGRDLEFPDPIPAGANLPPAVLAAIGAAPASTSMQSALDEAKLEAAVQQEMKRQQAAQTRANALATTKAERDPMFGSLLDEFSMDDFKADPGFQFRQQEGEKALQRQLAAGGKFFSGQALKDMQRFSQGLAAQEFGSAFDRSNVNKTNTFNRLASIAGVGQTAANQTGAAAANFGARAGSNIIGAGNAMAAGRVGAANAINSGIGQGFSMYQNQQLMNNLFKQPPSSFGSSPMSNLLYSNGSLGD